MIEDEELIEQKIDIKGDTLNAYLRMVILLKNNRKYKINDTID